MYQERKFGAIKHFKSKGARVMAVYFPDLLKQYKSLLKQMRARGITSGDMYLEVQKAIQWMETGYDPEEVRAKLRVDAYLMDPYNMQSYVAYINDDDMLIPEHLQTLQKQIVSRWIPDAEEKIKPSEFIECYFADFNRAALKAMRSKEMILKALEGLTDNEKTVFIAIRAENLTYQRVSDMLGISKGSVQSFLNRAQKKIQKNIGQANLIDNLKRSA